MAHDMNSLNENIFNRQYRLETQVQALYDPILPYHNFNHILSTLEFAENIVKDCLKQNININPEIVYLAVLFHDAGYYKNHADLGFKTKEAYSAELAGEVLSQYHYSESDIGRIKEAILSTEKNATFETPEQKAVRAADLAGMADSYSFFLTNNLRLKAEYELLNNSSLSWDNWKKASTNLVEEFVSSEIYLTDYFRKRGETSPFEDAVRKNLTELSLESEQPEIPNCR